MAPDNNNQSMPPATPWHQAVDVVRNHVVRILTPSGYGTGFLVAHGKNRGVSVIATASHVIAHANQWGESIRVEHISTGQSQLLREADRVIENYPARDTAAIILRSDALSLPEGELPLLAADKYLKVGSDIGWLGFPAMSADNMCFFSGHISAWLEAERSYLVDGVAINGVSGGPAFCISGGALTIIGLVSAYVANRASGETLPGLAVVRSVHQLHQVANKVNTLQEAKTTATSARTN